MSAHMMGWHEDLASAMNSLWCIMNIENQDALHSAALDKERGLIYTMVNGGRPPTCALAGRVMRGREVAKQDAQPQADPAHVT